MRQLISGELGIPVQHDILWSDSPIVSHFLKKKIEISARNCGKKIYNYKETKTKP